MIRAGTTVLAHQMGGSMHDTPLSWPCNEDHGIDVLSMSICTVLCRQHKLPRECFKLIWDHPKSARGICTVSVTYILQPVDDERDGILDDESTHTQCFVCNQPCRDADIDHSREDNCHRCFPCFLCPYCKILLPSGKQCCYDCLESEEKDLVPNQLRLQMLCPRFF